MLTEKHIEIIFPVTDCLPVFYNCLWYLCHSYLSIHAIGFPCQDIMVRYNRMKGRATLWLPGTDHAGIATQVCL